LLISNQNFIVPVYVFENINKTGKIIVIVQSEKVKAVNTLT